MVPKEVAAPLRQPQVGFAIPDTASSHNGPASAVVTADGPSSGPEVTSSLNWTEAPAVLPPDGQAPKKRVMIAADPSEKPSAEAKERDGAENEGSPKGRPFTHTRGITALGGDISSVTDSLGASRTAAEIVKKFEEVGTRPRQPETRTATRPLSVPRAL